MEFTIEQEALARALAMAAPVAQQKPGPFDLLGHLRFDAQGGELEISATDYDLAVKVCVPCAIDRPGKATILADTLAKVVGKLKGAIKVAQQDEKNCRFQSGRFQWSHDKGLNPDDFPALEVNMASPVEVPSELLRELWASAQGLAGSSDESRVWLNSVVLKADGEHLRLFGTTGFTGVVAEVPYPNGPWQVILPIVGMEWLAKHAPEEHALVRLSTSPVAVTAAVGPHTMIAKLTGDEAHLGPATQTLQKYAESPRIGAVKLSALRTVVDHLAPLLKEHREAAQTFGLQGTADGEIVATIDPVGGSTGRVCVDADVHRPWPKVWLNLSFLSRIVQRLGAAATTPDAIISICADPSNMPMVFADDARRYIIMPVHATDYVRAPAVAAVNAMMDAEYDHG